eukprot:g17910.t1
MGPTAAETEEEEREPGALAPRQPPGDGLSVTAGASGAFATSSVDFGFGNSWSHIPIPVGDHSPHHHHESKGLHEATQRGGGAAIAGGGNSSSRGAGRHSDDDKAMRDSHPAAAAAAAAAAGQQEAKNQYPPAPAAATARAAGKRAGGLKPTLGYDPDVSGTNSLSLAEIETGERIRAHGSSGSGSVRVDTAAPGCPALPPDAGEGGRATPPTEQVSLPDDIYGAARVSEYWHGVPGLSSLASMYVYDDIWAGDGGLNPREDILSITGWAAGGGHAATKDRGGGGEAVAEIFGVGSHTGAQRSQTVNPSSAAGSEGRGRAEHNTSGGWGKGPSSSSSSSSNSSNSSSSSSSRRRRRLPGKSAVGGSHDEDRSSPDSSEERNGGLGWDDGRSWGAGGDRAHSSGGAAADRRRGCKDEEGHASKKRCTPSPEAERRQASGTGSGSGSADGALRELQAQREAEVIRWCQEVSRPHAMSEAQAAAAAAAAAASAASAAASGGSSGDEERFFAGRVLEPAPRPPPRRYGGGGSRHTRSASLENGRLGDWEGGGMKGDVSSAKPPEVVAQGDRGGGELNGDGSGNGIAGGGFHGHPSRGGNRATEAALMGAPSTALPAASSGCGNGSQAGARIAAALAPAASSGAAAAAAASEAAAALENEAIPKGAAGAARHGSSCSSSFSDKNEALFASHTLEPKPRLRITVAPPAAQGGPREPGEHPSGFGGIGGAGSATESLGSPKGSSSSGVAGSHHLIPREEEVLATPMAGGGAAAAAAAAAEEAESSSSTDWQVRPEAMTRFFTTVRGVSHPSLLRPGRRRASGVRARPPSPRRGQHYPAAFPRGEPNPSGGLPPAPGSFGGGVDAMVAAAAAARQRAAEIAQDAKLSSDPGNAGAGPREWSCGSADVGGDADGGGEGGGGGDSSWGW